MLSDDERPGDVAADLVERLEALGSSLDEPAPEAARAQIRALWKEAPPILLELWDWCGQGPFGLPLFQLGRPLVQPFPAGEPVLDFSSMKLVSPSDRWSKCRCEMSTASSAGMCAASIPGRTFLRDTRPTAVVSTGSVSTILSPSWSKVVACPTKVTARRADGSRGSPLPLQAEGGALPREDELGAGDGLEDEPREGGDRMPIERLGRLCASGTGHEDER